MPTSLFSVLLPLALALPQVSAGASPGAWAQLLDPCPRSCSETASSAEWAIYDSLDQLSTCNRSTLVEFSLYSPSTVIRACSNSPQTQSLKVAQAVVANKDFQEEEVKLEVGWWNTKSSAPVEGVKSTVQNVRNALSTSNSSETTTSFSYSGNALVGLYAGKKILHSDAANTAVQHFVDYIESQDTVGRALLQYCGVNANKGLGIVVDTTGDFEAVRSIMRGWNDAECQTGFDGSKDILDGRLSLKRPPVQPASTSTTTASSRATPSHISHLHARHSIHRRATCQTIQVVSGDGCWSLSTECGITVAQFEEYNPVENLCSSLSSLQVGQYVCCTPGNLPDFTPQPEADGTCASYVVQPDEWCSTIAAANGISIDDIEEFNKNTWGWMGCDILQAQQRICLSEGDAPMPAIVDNAVCGPQVPGTHKPADMSKVADLNPCPLKACCNIWGQCGITDEFCTITESPTGAPGTAAKDTDGCISNCGTDIANNDSGPSEFISIGYFEAWNFERECLNMDITNFDSSTYTHLHFAFAEITSDYHVDISPVQDQFNKMLNMGSVRRILSFGGWSFSTEADSAPIFRQGVTDANRALFATNVVDFIVEHNLEGVDFDWEYPGAPDIPGIPPGDEGDGERYLQFLKLVRERLPEGKTLAIAAPASFWYLKGFPIAEISEVVDYIVYMTYDLHGQWDYDNQYAIIGCKGGDCLRSHVNLTETMSALSMVTKAGVPSNKIIVGLSSYGRSFQMTEAGCTGPMCRYVGPDSGATPGECTKTAGYISDAEINRILEEDDTAVKTYDESSDSNIMVYDSTQWVAYMDQNTKISRTDYYQDLNMGGTTDWAVDLQSFAWSSGSGDGSGGGSGGGAFNQSTVYIDNSIWEGDAASPAEIHCVAPCVLVLPDFPLDGTSVYTRPPYHTTLDVAWPTVTKVTTNGAVITSTTVTRILQETTINAPKVTVTSLPMANINITIPLGDDDEITITPKPRFPAQTVTITNDPNPLNETGVRHPPVTRTVTLPPWPQTTVIYYPPPDNTGSDKEDNSSDDPDDDIDLPPIPDITIKDGPSDPQCDNCPNPGSLCDDLFCFCFLCPPSSGGGGGDGGFVDPSDPNPPPRPPTDQENNPNEEECTEPETVTNYWHARRRLRYHGHHNNYRRECLLYPGSE
ncbi:CAZyme family GH18 [Penicillium roqueforti]|nr:CAZyme family GH18 [Penicillium roqueforti]KAI3260789.1 CAZyme family GH18 [Penicillium roqueforti]KAI3276437.1 CAZyme family GH18 [Penicillium roqueforti]